MGIVKSIKRPGILFSVATYPSPSSKQHSLSSSFTQNPFLTLNHLANSAKMVSPTKLALIVASALGAVSAVPAAAPSPESSVPGVAGSTVAIADVAEKRDLHKRATVQFQAYENTNYGGASLVISVNDNSCCKFSSYDPSSFSGITCLHCPSRLHWCLGRMERPHLLGQDSDQRLVLLHLRVSFIPCVECECHDHS
jgi:hypothetical protein